MVNEVKAPAVFTPENEPYLGGAELHRFDITIIGATRANRAVAEASHATNLSDLQKAACQIIPQGVSIALSIRKLIRQGYLLSAFILVRPLIERSATMSWLVRHPEAVDSWNNGWRHGERPSLRRMLEAMQSPGAEEPMAQEICQLFGHAVHGDPLASHWNLVDLEEGDIGYSSGRILNRPDFCDIIAANTFPFLIVLMAMMVACFPSASEASEAIIETIERVVGKPSEEEA